MIRRIFLAALLVGVSLGAAQAAPKKTYKYRCTKCGLIQEFTRPGVKKCPNDGRTMIRVY